MNTTTKLSTLLLLTTATGLTACGHADVNSQNPAPPQYTEATPVPAATWAPGIYVAANDGDDSAAGTPDKPKRTISAALDAARAGSLNDVYLFGDGLNGSYPEIVVLQQATNIHGGLCHAKPMVVDTANCATAIVGGSPSMIVDGVTAPIVIDNLSIIAAPTAQNDGTTPTDFFEIPSIGCVGRGETPLSAHYLGCQNGPGIDSQGRTIPQSSMAVVLVKSENVSFLHDHIESGDAANGLPGFDGAAGASAPVNATNGGSVPQSSFSSEIEYGTPGAGGVNPQCHEADGTAGGVGGYFGFKQSTIGLFTLKIPVAFAATPGVDTAPVSGGAAGEFDYRNQYGMAGGTAETASDPIPNGADGNTASSNIDATLLVAGSGSNGQAGFAGFGGVGGGGGAAGTVVLSEKVQSSSGTGFVWQVVGIGGASGDNYSVTTNVGETPAGGGGGGGAGGCGGQGGTGGQGGATSVAVYMVGGSASFPQSTIVTGKGGSGGNGGKGGTGGEGAVGADGGKGGQTGATNESYQMSGDMSAGFSVFSVSVSYSSNVTTARSGSGGGKGGDGAKGQDGSAGGNGAGGAGGASIGVIVKGGAVSNISQATVLLGEAGNGGGPSPVVGLTAEQYGVN